MVKLIHHSVEGGGFVGLQSVNSIQFNSTYKHKGLPRNYTRIFSDDSVTDILHYNMQCNLQ